MLHSRLAQLSAVVICLASCKSPDQQAPKLASELSEGFADEHTLISKGKGLSFAEAKTPARHEAAGKEGARIDALQRALQFCVQGNCNPDNDGCVVQDRYALSLTDFGKKFSAALKRARRLESGCVPEGKQWACYVWIAIEMQDLRQQCDQVRLGPDSVK